MDHNPEVIYKQPEKVRPHGLSGYQNEIVEDDVKAARKSLLNMLINSTALFVSAYLVSYIILQLITMAIANSAGIQSVLYYYELAFNISNYSPEWTAGRIVLVTAAPPILMTLVGFIILFIIVRRYSWGKYTLMFLLWLGFHMVNTLLGGILAGAITDHGIGYTLDIFFWPTYMMYLLFILLGIFSLIVVGMDCTESFLLTTPAGYWSKRKNRRQYLLFTLEFPWLIGSVMLFLVRFPDHIPQHESITIHDFILTLSLIFLILPIFFKGRNFQTWSDSTANEQGEKVIWPLLIFTVVMVLCFRLCLTGSFYSLIG